MSSPPSHSLPDLFRTPSAAVLAQVADALAWPLFVVHADATLLHANLAARRLLQRGAPLLLGPARRLMPALPQRRAALQDALLAAEQGQRRVLHWADADASFSASVSALGSSGSGPAPLLLALTAIGGQAAGAAAYAQLHGLSAAETRVLQRLALGEDGPRAAAHLGVSPATVRSQVASMRRKTGCASVRELLQALNALPPLGP